MFSLWGLLMGWAWGMLHFFWGKSISFLLDFEVVELGLDIYFWSHTPPLPHLNTKRTQL